uniref:Uncharacterized protein n=1 Tax=Oryza brachyantha TaxID=4533 RepID=J3LJF6_ORYBR
MAHDPSLGFADYFSAADAAASPVVTALMPPMDAAAPDLFGLQAGMELLGVRGLAMMPGATTGKVAALVDAGGGDDDDDGSTMRFLSEQHHHHHQQQPSQAPLSLSLRHPEGALHPGGAARQQLAAPVAPWMHQDYPSPSGQGAGEPRIS